MTKTIENPTIILSKESDELIKNSYKNRNKSKKNVQLKKLKSKKKFRVVE
jgi:hypothetical protein